MKRQRVYAIDVAKAYKRRKVTRTPAISKPLIGRVVPGYTRRVGNYGRYNKGRYSGGILPEKKFFDTTLSFACDLTMEVPATGQLCLIPQGDTENTRDGRKAFIKSIQIRGVMQFTPGAAAVGVDVAYLYLVLDTQCNGAAAAVTDVFTSVNGWSNMLQLNNSGRFRILKKWVLPMESSAGVTTAYNSMLKPIEFYKRCNIPIDWNSTTGAITEIRSNNIFLIAGGLVDDTCGFNGTCRLRFMG